MLVIEKLLEEPEERHGFFSAVLQTFLGVEERARGIQRLDGLEQTTRGFFKGRLHEVGRLRPAVLVALRLRALHNAVAGGGQVLALDAFGEVLSGRLDLVEQRGHFGVVGAAASLSATARVRPAVRLHVLHEQLVLDALLQLIFARLHRRYQTGAVFDHGVTLRVAQPAKCSEDVNEGLEGGAGRAFIGDALLDLIAIVAHFGHHRVADFHVPVADVLLSVENHLDNFPLAILLDTVGRARLGIAIASMPTDTVKRRS